MNHPLSAKPWPLLVVASATGLGLLAPLTASGQMALPAPVHVAGHIITLVMLADLVVRWKRNGGLAAYGYRWLAADLLAALPLGLITGIPGLEVLRLAKLGRVVQAMRDLWSVYIDKWNTFRLLYSGIWIAFVVHWLSCGWLALRAASTDLDNTGNTYLRALYWTVTTLTSVGYGDIIPRTDVETLYAILVMAAGVGMFGYVIGNIAHIITNMHPSRVRYIETMEGLNAFMEYRGLPSQLQHRIREYYAYRWEKRLGFDESTILNDLSVSLQGEVSLFLKKDVIEKVPFFKGATEELVREISLAMQPRVYMPGDPIFRAGEQGEEMFFIGRGEVHILGKDGSSIQAVLRDGDFFGEGALVLGQPRSATVRAVGYCDLYALDKPSFKSIMQRHPEFAAHIEAMIKERFGPHR
ncbi:MAG: cyclic nucleotide-binding domain-containing protein [Ignavibacteriae bacterium]|nr:cyclic nucleotide-binding domain-containing protein [Ignavibacteriota bacterium]